MHHIKPEALHFYRLYMFFSFETSAPRLCRRLCYKCRADLPSLLVGVHSHTLFGVSCRDNFRFYVCSAFHCWIGSPRVVLQMCFKWCRICPSTVPQILDIISYQITSSSCELGIHFAPSMHQSHCSASALCRKPQFLAPHRSKSRSLLVALKGLMLECPQLWFPEVVLTLRPLWLCPCLFLSILSLFLCKPPLVWPQVRLALLALPPPREPLELGGAVQPPQWPQQHQLKLHHPPQQPLPQLSQSGGDDDGSLFLFPSHPNPWLLGVWNTLVTSQASRKWLLSGITWSCLWWNEREGTACNLFRLSSAITGKRS